MNEPTIYCLKCGSMKKVEEVYKNARIYTPISEIDVSGDLEYDRENATIEEGEVECYQCAECGTPFKDANGHIVDTCDGLAELAQAGRPSIDYPSIFEDIKEMQHMLHNLQNCKEAADSGAKPYYMDARTALLDAKAKHIAAIEERIGELGDLIRNETDGKVSHSYQIERQRLESDLEEAHRD